MQKPWPSQTACKGYYDLLVHMSKIESFIFILLIAAVSWKGYCSNVYIQSQNDFFLSTAGKPVIRFASDTVLEPDRVHVEKTADSDIPCTQGPGIHAQLAIHVSCLLPVNRSPTS